MNRSNVFKPAFPTTPSYGKLPGGHLSRKGYQPHPTYHGFCRSCCHPVSKCCCGYRDCRKEAKELLVTPTKDQSRLKRTRMMSFLNFMGAPEEGEKKAAGEKAKVEMAEEATFVRSQEKFKLLSRQVAVGTGNAFIGGGCCVHLSIEYMPTVGIAGTPGLVLAMVVDSENTTLAWGKITDADDGYCIKEGIITTKPGATLLVQTINVTARVRWCEVFSC